MDALANYLHRGHVQLRGRERFPTYPELRRQLAHGVKPLPPRIRVLAHAANRLEHPVDVPSQAHHHVPFREHVQLAPGETRGAQPSTVLRRGLHREQVNVVLLVDDRGGFQEGHAVVFGPHLGAVDVVSHGREVLADPRLPTGRQLRPVTRELAVHRGQQHGHARDPHRERGAVVVQHPRGEARQRVDPRGPRHLLRPRPQEQHPDG